MIELSNFVTIQLCMASLFLNIATPSTPAYNHTNRSVSVFSKARMRIFVCMQITSLMLTVKRSIAIDKRLSNICYTVIDAMLSIGSSKVDK